MNTEIIYQFTISPDFLPKQLSGWYIFNTWLQKSLQIQSHLETYHDFDAQRNAILNDRVDLIYANPYDAANLIRNKGFVALARADNVTDECVVAVAQSSNYTTVEDLQPGIRISRTNDPNINLIGMILLEPADLSTNNVLFVEADNYVLIAKALLNHQADVGFFLRDAYDSFSSTLRDQLRPLIISQLDDIRHILLAGPRLAGHIDQLKQMLAEMSTNAAGRGVLEAMEFTNWTTLSPEDSEFMVDLIDTFKA